MHRVGLGYAKLEWEGQVSAVGASLIPALRSRADGTLYAMGKEKGEPGLNVLNARGRSSRRG